jgi:type III effector protein AvrRpm1
MGGCISKTGGTYAPATYGSDGYESDVEKRNDQAPSPRRSRVDPALSGLVPLAKRVYEHSTLYHGTKREHVPSIRKNGFRTDCKSDGATEGGGGNFMMRFSSGGVTASSEHHYLSSSRQMAKDFAMYADPDQPALVRTIGVANNFHLEHDPYSEGPALRTRDSIPPAHVLGSKRSPAGANANVFREEMQKAGHDVSTKQAGQLLKEVQSDSEDDAYPSHDEFIIRHLGG